VHLVGIIYNNIITMHGTMNIKSYIVLSALSFQDFVQVRTSEFISALPPNVS